MTAIRRFLVAGATLIIWLPAFAHHAVVSTYDVTKTTSVQGVVTKFLFRNPHARVYFEVTNADGSVTNWVGDGSASTILRREGWTAKSLEAGNFIQIVGRSSRDGSPMVMMDSVSLLNPDGTIASEISGSVEDFSLTYGAQLIDLPLQREDNTPNLSGIWTGQGSPYTPPRAVKPELTEAGAALQASYDITTDHQVFCDKPGIVRQAGMTPHGVKISQLEDRVVFEYEEYGITHEAFFDATKVLPGLKTHFGSSFARYEDGALIVETINLLSNPIHADAYSYSDEAQVVQTYERVDEPGTSALIRIRTVISDPVNYAEDFEIENIKIASEPYEFIENNCVPPLRERTTVHPAMNVFLTSIGLSDDASADAHCSVLAARVGQGDKDWRAYLRATGGNNVNARGRIGSGPWYTAKGDVVAIDLENLLSDAGSDRAEPSIATERGSLVSAQNLDRDGLFYCFATE